MNKISHNILCNKSRYERVQGRDFLVLEAMAVKGDTAMNGIMYPMSVVSAKAAELKNKPAPLSHPKKAGMHTSANDFFVKGAFDIGAQVIDSKMIGDENIAEVWIDKEVAERTEKGKDLLNRAENKMPIGVSTGLIPRKVRNEEGTDKLGQRYNKVVEQFDYDHLALLLDEKAAGAAAGTQIIYNESQEALIVNHEDGGQPESQQEENSMKVEFDISDLSKAERVQFGALTVNEIMEAVNREFEPVSLDDAKEVVTNAGLLVNSSEDGEFITKEDAQFLANAKKLEVERVNEIRENIVANSEMTNELVKDMNEDQLMGIYNSLDTRKKDYSMNDTVVTNSSQTSEFEVYQPKGA